MTIGSTLLLFKPSDDALESLVTRLLPHLNHPTTRQDLMERLQSQERGLHSIIQEALVTQPDSHRLVLVVDQFEEVFTLCRNEAVRTQFINNLLYASTLAGGQTIVIITMRVDFLGRCAAYPQLAARLSERTILVETMQKEDLRLAIEGPAQEVGLHYEKGLVETILDDLGQEPGLLPLLQYTLLQLWKKKRGHWLTIDTYYQLSGVKGALAERADEEYGKLTPEQQQAARRVLLRLTQPGEGTEATRRRAPLTELLPAGAGADDVELVIRRLVDAHLLVTGKGGEGQEIVDVAHETLIWAWPRFRGWLEADRVGLFIHHFLTQTAQEWQKHHRDAGYLYSGTRLVQAEEWVKEHPGYLNPLEQEFLKTSLRQRGLRRLRQTAMVILTPLVAIALVLLVTYLAEWDIVASTDSGWLTSNEWLNSTGGVGRYGAAVAANPTSPELIYTADRSKGGLYQSADAGQTWKNIAGVQLADKVIRNIAVAKDGTIYITTSAGMFYSQNEGDDWVSLPGPSAAPPTSVIRAISVNPDDSQNVLISIWPDQIWTTKNV